MKPSCEKKRLMGERSRWKHASMSTRLMAKSHAAIDQLMTPARASVKSRFTPPV